MMTTLTSRDVTQVTLAQRVRPLLPRLAGGAIALLVLFVLTREMRKLDLVAAWQSLLQADRPLLLAAIVVFAMVAPLRTLRWRVLLQGASSLRLPTFPRLLAIWVQGWAGNCVTVAQLGDVYRADLLQRAVGVPRSTTLGAIVVERLVDLGVLSLLLVGATMSIAGSTLSGARTAGLLVLALVGVVAVTIVIAVRLRDAWQAVIPPSVASALSDGMTAARHSLPQLPVAALLSGGGWILEASMVWLLAQALHVPLTPAGALLTALVAAVLTAIPFTPSGLGFTEAGMVAVLLALGVAPAQAAALTILVRLITYWGVVVIGLGLSAWHPLRGGNPAAPSDVAESVQERTPTMLGRQVRLVPVATVKRRDDVTVDIVIPVFNEEAQLAASVTALRDYLCAFFPYNWSITIADNASTDGTRAIAQELAQDPRVQVLRLEEKGRGRALKAAWLGSQADVMAYMDVDLSTNLESFLPLVAPLVSGHSDLAIGSRLHRGAVVTRQWKREILSRGYNFLIRAMFRNGFSDAQCGFKAITRRAAQALLPDVQDNAWFFDTELLLLAEARGYRIHEVPVDWIEDLDSRVNIPTTVTEDLKGLWRMRTASVGKRPSMPAGRWLADAS